MKLEDDLRVGTNDAYLEPAFRSRRPQVVGVEGRAHWIIDSQIYPRWTGRGCHIMGTPTAHSVAHRSARTDLSKPARPIR